MLDAESVSSLSKSTIPFKLKQEIQHKFKDSGCDIKTLFAFKWDATKRDLYNFKFDDTQELASIFEAMNI